jgi:hypothetical protein
MRAALQAGQGQVGPCCSPLLMLYALLVLMEAILMMSHHPELFQSSARGWAIP